MRSVTALPILLIIFAPGSAAAQANASAYCAALVEKYDTYIDTAGDKGGRATPTDIAVAEGKCKSDPAAAIPVLEKAR